MFFSMLLSIPEIAASFLMELDRDASHSVCFSRPVQRSLLGSGLNFDKVKGPEKWCQVIFAGG